MSDGNEEDVERTTHVDCELGLWIPLDLREFTSQIVFRTPRATIQHFGSKPLEGYYGSVDASHFGDPEEMLDPRNPNLAPDRVSIKPQGEEPTILRVEDVETDGVSDGHGDRVSRIPPCPSCERKDQVVEAPAAGYWICERCGERGSGIEEPVWWRNDPDSQWYNGDEVRADGGRDSLELTERERERIEAIKDQCDGPELTDNQVLSSLLDTWDAVEDGQYGDGRPFEDLKPYWNVATEIEDYVEDTGSSAAQGCRNLGWIALGGRGMASRDGVANTLESIARNAESLAEQVRELDDPRQIREERGRDE